MALWTVWEWPPKQEWEYGNIWAGSEVLLLKAHLCLLVKLQQSLVTLENCPWTWINLDPVWKAASSQEEEENVDVNFDLSALILDNCQFAVSQALGPCTCVCICVGVCKFVCVGVCRGIAWVYILQLRGSFWTGIVWDSLPVCFCRSYPNVELDVW